MFPPNRRLSDSLLFSPPRPAQLQSRALRDTRELIQRVSAADVYTFVEQSSHPRLWRILAEDCLEKLEFAVAEKAFVRLSDYCGIRFCRRLQQVDGRLKQKAEVKAYFGLFDDAEALYRQMDRADLALEMRTRAGDWFTVERAAAAGDGDDDLLRAARTKLGDHFFDRQQWAQAAEYYGLAHNVPRLVECAYACEDYALLEQLARELPEGSPILADVGAKLEAVGLCEGAAAAFLRLGDVQAAVACCVALSQWDQAVRLAEAHRLPEIEQLLSGYAARLLEREDFIAAVELYRKAHRHIDAADLLSKMADRGISGKANPLRAKQLYVLAALELDEHRARRMAAGGAGGAGASGGAEGEALARMSAALDGLTAASADGAEARCSLGSRSPASAFLLLSALSAPLRCPLLWCPCGCGCGWV